MGATNYTTNSDMLTLLALRVKEYRLAARMSQKELAEQSGVSQTTISHFEQGVSRNLTLANFISCCVRSVRNSGSRKSCRNCPCRRWHFGKLRN